MHSTRTKKEWMKRDVEMMYARLTKRFKVYEYCSCGDTRRLTKIMVGGIQKYKCTVCDLRWRP